jgi:hypothetical protein
VSRESAPGWVGRCWRVSAVRRGAGSTNTVLAQSFDLKVFFHRRHGGSPSGEHSRSDRVDQAHTDLHCRDAFGSPGFQRLGPNVGGGAEASLGGCWSCDVVVVRLVVGTDSRVGAPCAGGGRMPARANILKPTEAGKLKSPIDTARVLYQGPFTFHVSSGDTPAAI